MKERIGTRAIAAAGGEIEWNIVVADGVQGVEEVVTDSGCDGEIGSDLPFVLRVREVLRFALTHQGQDRGVGGGTHVVVHERGGRGVSQCSALRGSLIQQNPARFESEFENVFSFGPGKIVDKVESLRRIVGGGCAGQRAEAGYGHAKWNG